MDCQLLPRTEAGKRFVALAESHSSGFSESAAQHDRDGTFPAENLDALRECGVLAATVPEELGGLGVESIFDFAVGINRLARNDGSTALAVNMHLFLSLANAREWRAALKAGASDKATRLEELLRNIGAGKAILSALVTEPGRDHLHPHTEATRTDGGWLLNGRKGFGTGSPCADLLAVILRYRNESGEDRIGGALVSNQNPGVEIMNNWDAMGMRASGSHDVSFANCFVPEQDFWDSGPWGEFYPRYLSSNAIATVGLISAFLGIAEAARNITIQTILGRRRPDGGRQMAERYSIQHGLAEVEVASSAARAAIEHAGGMLDACLSPQQFGEMSLEDLHFLMKEVQCAKLLVTGNAIEIVNRALTLSGGAGYMTRNQLSRLYRDVRAGPFMQPFSPNEAYEYIGKVTIGLDPRLAL